MFISIQKIKGKKILVLQANPATMITMKVDLGIP